MHTAAHNTKRRQRCALCALCTVCMRFPACAFPTLLLLFYFILFFFITSIFFFVFPVALCMARYTYNTLLGSHTTHSRANDQFMCKIHQKELKHSALSSTVLFWADRMAHSVGVCVAVADVCQGLEWALNMILLWGWCWNSWRRAVGLIRQSTWAHVKSASKPVNGHFLDFLHFSLLHVFVGWPSLIFPCYVVRNYSDETGD